MEISFPIEFLVAGTPVSLQVKRAKSRDDWKERVKRASKPALPEGHLATEAPVAVTLFYFPAEPMQGDLDNIVKPVLDALTRHIYVDDAQVDRILIQRFEPDNIFPFAAPSPTLEQAMNDPKPLSYVRVSTDPFEELT